MTDDECDAFEKLLGVTLEPYQRQIVRDMRAGKRVLHMQARTTGKLWLNWLACAPTDQLQEMLGVVSLFAEIREFMK